MVDGLALPISILSPRGTYPPGRQNGNRRLPYLTVPLPQEAELLSCFPEREGGTANIEPWTGRMNIYIERGEVNTIEPWVL